MFGIARITSSDTVLVTRELSVCNSSEVAEIVTDVSTAPTSSRRSTRTVWFVVSEIFVRLTCLKPAFFADTV